MDLMPIVDHLQARGHGTKGRDLFVYTMHETVMAGLLVTAQMPIMRDRYVHKLFRGEFQVIARGAEHEEIRARLESVSNTLNARRIVLGTMDFRFIFPKQAPLVFPRADSRLLEASVNFEFAFTQTV